jgi:hypothetical protein
VACMEPAYPEAFSPLLEAHRPNLHNTLFAGPPPHVNVDQQIWAPDSVSGLAGEAIMLCMEPMCVRMMQLASFTLSFT